MTQVPDKELDEIGARADRALPGPWRLFDQYEPDNLARENVVLWNDPHLAEGVDGWVCQVPGDPADAEFIAHAREDVPRLIAYLRAKNAEVERLRPLAEMGQAVVDHAQPADEFFSAAERFNQVVTVAEDLAIALHHCSVYLPLFIEDGRRLDRALAVNEQVQTAMAAYCDLTGTRRQDLNDRTVSPKDRP